MAQSDSQRERGSGVLERHVVTVITSLILAAVIWVGGKVSLQGEDISAIKKELTLNAQYQAERTDALTERVMRVERRVERLEDGTMVEVVRRYIEQGSRAP